MTPRQKKRWLRLLLALAIVLVSWFSGRALQPSGLGKRIEQRSYDLRFQLRGPLPVPDSAPITILAIDERSLQEIPEPLMLWQRHFAPLIDRLAEARAGALGLDFIFEDLTSLDPEGQRAFHQSLLQARRAENPLPVILARGLRQPPLGLRLAAGSRSFAFANLTHDEDDFIRRQQIYSGPGADGEAQPGFALAVALAAQGLPFDPASREREVQINYLGRSPFEQVSFVEALQAARRGDQAFFTQHFAGRIVLVGRTGGQDLHSTPLYYWPPEGGTLRTVGLLIQASTIATLLEGNAIRQPQALTQGLSALLLTALVTLFCFRLPPLKAWGAGLAAAAAYLAAAIWWAFAAGWWLWVVFPAWGALSAMALSTSADYLLQGREKRRLRSLFQRYVSDEVIGRILETPDELALQGERRAITVLFSDIRGFTARSSGEDAQVVVRYLNRYLERMVEAIQSNQGMIDKFIGDGIMAVFGAPLQDNNSVLNAVQAALDMSSALRGLNREFEAEGLQPLRIGIGIHCGEAVVGNIGSTQRMEYTAIGDVVNTASRIEGLTKVAQVEILISQQAHTALAGRIATQSAGEFKAKGKAQPLSLYCVEAGGERDRSA